LIKNLKILVYNLNKKTYPSVILIYIKEKQKVEYSKSEEIISETDTKTNKGFP